MSRFRPLFVLSVIVILLTVLSACGSGAPVAPEPTATSAPPTAAPGQLTVADIIAMANPAWADVVSMRTTSQSGPTPQEGENLPFSGVIQDWTSKGNRHLIEFQDGNAINEQIYVDGVVYMRGQFVSAAVAPGIDVNTWVVIDPAVIAEQSPVGARVSYLARVQETPYGPLTDDLLARPVTESGTATIGTRTCTVYTFGDESDSGTEIRYEIAVSNNGLPCQVIQRAGEFQNSTVYEFDDNVTIDAPLDGTPVSATPEG